MSYCNSCHSYTGRRHEKRRHETRTKRGKGEEKHRRDRKTQAGVGFLPPTRTPTCLGRCPSCPAEGLQAPRPELRPGAELSWSPRLQRLGDWASGTRVGVGRRWGQESRSRLRGWHLPRGSLSNRALTLPSPFSHHLRLEKVHEMQ